MMRKKDNVAAPVESGRAYVAVRRISNLKNETLAAVGETCERVPAEAIEDLLSNGDIRKVEE